MREATHTPLRAAAQGLKKDQNLPAFVRVLPTKRGLLRVDPTRLELVTSAMRLQHYRFLEDSRAYKSPANSPIYCVVLFLSF